LQERTTTTSTVGYSKCMSRSYRYHIMGPYIPVKLIGKCVRKFTQSLIKVTRSKVAFFLPLINCMCSRSRSPHLIHTKSVRCFLPSSATPTSQYLVVGRNTILHYSLLSVLESLQTSKQASEQASKQEKKKESKQAYRQITKNVQQCTQ
jgi:hypothetical protein